MRTLRWLLLVALALAAAGPVGAQRRPALPRQQYLRVNDTLVLEMSRPLARFLITSDVPGNEPARGQPGTRVVWGKAALRGRRGYYEVLPRWPSSYYTLYLAAVSARGEVVALSCWGDSEEQAPKVRAYPPDTVWVNVSEGQGFGYRFWDVRYHTWSYMEDAEGGPLPSPPEAEEVLGFEQTIVGFTGGTYRGRTYHVLSYWLNRELARVRRTHRLPSEQQLNMFLTTDLLVDDYPEANYRPLLAQLLRAYTACPQSGNSAERIAEARQELASQASPKKKR